MAEVANIRSAEGLDLNTATVQGKIDKSRRADGGKWFTHIITPAPDEYSHPQTLEIRSDKKLGDTGEVLTQRVRLGGFRRKFQYADKDSGEVLDGENVRISLDAIEG